MARIDNISNFLTDVANSIRAKKGTTYLITPSNFDTEIESIETGGGDEELLNSFISVLDDSKGKNCTKLPDGLTTIRNAMFDNFTEMQLTELPNTVKTIGQKSFYYCNKMNLKSLPDGLTSIGNSAFYYCSNMTISELPNTLTSIGSSAFGYCEKITIKNIPEGVTVLNNSSFRHCQGITELEIKSNNVTRIYGYSLDNTNISKLILRNITPPTLDTDALTNTPIARGTGFIYVPDESVEAYKTSWSTYANQIKGISELEG